MMRFAPAACLLLSVSTAVAQIMNVRPAFEAAAVKAVEAGRIGLGSLRGGPGTNSPGQFMGVATMKLLLMRAYNLKEYQIVGLGWIDSARYEIQAKVPAGASKAQAGLMLQSLLAERFGLAAHRETRQLAAYDLVVAKGGPKLTLSKQANERGDDDSGITPSPKFIKGADGLPELPPGSDVTRTYAVVLSGPDGLLYKLWGRRETISQLADRLSTQLNRPVIDATGLKGEYDFTLTWTVEGANGGLPPAGPPPDQIETTPTPVLSGPGLSILGALQVQLGLRLNPKRRPLEVLVIDRVSAKPRDN